MSLVGELKRRNVFRVGAAYLVSAWLLIEIADIMFPAFGFPQGALKWLVGALALGLIPILVFSWAYELTEHGIVRDKGPQQENPQAPATAQRLNQVTIIMILLALAVIVVERFVLPQRIVEPDVAVQADSGEASGEAVDEPPPVPSAPPDRPLPEGPSVAVLPFTNMSPDPENEYFADGISEEILNVLAGIEGLKVASRTSAFSFKGTNTPIPQIASQLGVAHVLEGSVRRAGDRVRITAQLIDAGTDQHLWSDSYDRDLTDIFAVQEEIATAISAALEQELGFEPARAVSVAAPTQDLRAYELYLQGRTLFYQRGDALVAARASLEEAVGRDPEFAEAWASLAGVLYVSPSYVAGLDLVPTHDLAIRAAERARTLDDQLALPYAVLGGIRSTRAEPLEGYRLLNGAVERDPDDSTALLWRGITNVRAGYIKNAVSDFRRAQEIDPQVGITNGWLGASLVHAGRYEEAQEYLERGIALGWAASLWNRVHLDLARGDLDAARRDYRRYTETIETSFASDPVSVEAARRSAAAFGDPEAERAFVAWIESRPDAGSWSSVVLAFGFHKEAFALESDPAREPDPFFIQNAWFPSSRAAVEEPGFLELAEARGFLALWQAEGFPDGCELVTTPARRLECAR